MIHSIHKTWFFILTGTFFAPALAMNTQETTTNHSRATTSMFDLPADQLYKLMKDHEKGQVLLEQECKLNLAQRLEDHKKAKHPPVYVSHPSLVPNGLARPYLWSKDETKNYSGFWAHEDKYYKENDKLEHIAGNFAFAAKHSIELYGKIKYFFKKNGIGCVARYLRGDSLEFNNSPYFLTINNPTLQKKYYPYFWKTQFELTLNHELTHCEQNSNEKIINKFGDDLLGEKVGLGTELENSLPYYLDMLKQDEHGNFYLEEKSKPLFASRGNLLCEAEADIVAIQKSTNPYALKTVYKMAIGHANSNNYASYATLYHIAKQQCKKFYADKSDLYLQHKRETKVNLSHQYMQEKKTRNACKNA